MGEKAEPMSGYDPVTGLPLDKSYLERGLPPSLVERTAAMLLRDKSCMECSLPPFLIKSVAAMQTAWDMLDRGEEYFGWDLDYYQLQSDINSAEIDLIISSEQASYLREKYLKMKRRTL